MSISNPEVRKILNPLIVWFRELKAIDVRVGIILCTSRIDEDLCQLLKKVMRHHPGSGKDELFDTDKPFGTYSARILLAYRLGLIDRDFESYLQSSRKLRNAAAHAQHPIDLSQTPHIDRVVHMNRLCQSRRILTDETFNPHEDPAGAVMTSLLYAILALELSYDCAVPFQAEEISFSSLKMSSDSTEANNEPSTKTT